MDEVAKKLFERMIELLEVLSRDIAAVRVVSRQAKTTSEDCENISNEMKNQRPNRRARFLISSRNAAFGVERFFCQSTPMMSGGNFGSGKVRRPTESF